jgi:3-phosphoshikimate 1-carboxyvinyltransferase
MMTAPLLPNGLIIKLTGEIGSVPYISMTAALMKEFGVEPEVDVNRKTISVKNGNYKPCSVTIEADWSAASYWFAFVALAKEAAITLPNVSNKSLQGDRVIIDVMKQLGVLSEFAGRDLKLSKANSNEKQISWDFKDCPDLAQTVLPVCAAKGIAGEFVGLESLRIKETDRIAALKTELGKIGAVLSEPEVGRWRLGPGNISSLKKSIETYHDHRMAMGFAPWAALTEITIMAPEVVNKSYPDFWKDVKSVGYSVSEEK